MCVFLQCESESERRTEISRGVQWEAAAVCVVQRAAYPSWHIFCSGGVSLTLSHAARE